MSSLIIGRSPAPSSATRQTHARSLTCSIWRRHPSVFVVPRAIGRVSLRLGGGMFWKNVRFANGCQGRAQNSRTTRVPDVGSWRPRPGPLHPSGAGRAASVPRRTAGRPPVERRGAGSVGEPVLVDGPLALLEQLDRDRRAGPSAPPPRPLRGAAGPRRGRRRRPCRRPSVPGDLCRVVGSFLFPCCSSVLPLLVSTSGASGCAACGSLLLSWPCGSLDRACLVPIRSTSRPPFPAAGTLLQLRVSSTRSVNAIQMSKSRRSGLT